MTFAAALTAVRTIRRPFWHRERTLSMEREVSSAPIGVPGPDPLDWPPRRLQEELLHNLLRGLIR